jgi:cytidine deaminase
VTIITFPEVGNFKPLLVDMEDLELDQQAAMRAALDVQRLSKNRKFMVGAAAVAFDGTLVRIHNGISGTTTHAEQLVVGSLYAKTRSRAIKFLAIAGARKKEEVLRKNEQYVQGTPFAKIGWAKLCGKCLEYLHDCTGNVEDVVVGSYADSGQIVLTSTHALMPAPHISLRVPLEYDSVGNFYPTPSTEANKDASHGCGSPAIFRLRLQWNRLEPELRKLR